VNPEPSLTRVIADYVLLVLAYWWVIVPGVLMPGRDLIKDIGGLNWKETPRWLELTVIFACLFIAQFLAYRNAVQNLSTVIEEKRQFSITINAKEAELQTEKAKVEQLERKIGDIKPCKEKSNIVENPTGSIVNQDSQNFGTQSVYNTPPSRIIPSGKENDFVNALKTFPGGLVTIVKAGSSDDVAPLEGQIVQLAHRAGWGANYGGSVYSAEGTPQADGLECYLPRGWDQPMGRAFKMALQSANLKCKYFNTAYNFGGMGVGGLAFVIGRNMQP
jgi:hypothetical protein